MAQLLRSRLWTWVGLNGQMCCEWVFLLKLTGKVVGGVPRIRRAGIAQMLGWGVVGEEEGVPLGLGVGVMRFS